MGLALDSLFERRVGVRVYGLAAVVLGVVGLVWGDFAGVWQPSMSGGHVGRTALGYGVAVVPLVAGLAIQWRCAARFGALALMVFYGLAVLVLDVPRVVAHPGVFMNWYAVAEPLAVAAAGWVAYVQCSPGEPGAAMHSSAGGRWMFGVCLLVFGLAHLFYLGYTAKLVPAWLPPGRVFWVYATAAGHFAAGVALLSGVYARLAARILTGMFVVFGALVHAPTLFVSPHSHDNWAENAINLALIGSAWVIAVSLALDRPTQ